MSRVPCTPSDLQAALARLPDWTLDARRPALQRTFLFADFSQAFGYMTQVAQVAERMDHHPEWCNVYNRVEVVLTTHDAGGVTDLDIDMALAMNALADAAHGGGGGT